MLIQVPEEPQLPISVVDHCLMLSQILRNSSWCKEGRLCHIAETLLFYFTTFEAKHQVYVTVEPLFAYVLEDKVKYVTSQIINRSNLNCPFLYKKKQFYITSVDKTRRKFTEESSYLSLHRNYKYK